jgi:hypothetical protein
MKTLENDHLARDTIAENGCRVNGNDLDAAGYASINGLTGSDRRIVEAIFQECQYIRVWGKALDPDVWVQSTYDTFRWLRRTRPDLLGAPLQQWAGLRRTILRRAGHFAMVRELRSRSNWPLPLSEDIDRVNPDASASFEAAEARCLVEGIRSHLLSDGYAAEEIELILSTQLGYTYCETAEHLKARFGLEISSEAVRKRATRADRTLRQLIASAFELSVAVPA